jgi:hypothetical protein
MSNGSAGKASEHQIVPMNGPRVQTFPSKRVCGGEGCLTVLSIYNSTAFCSLHTQPVKSVINRPL